MNEVCTSLGDCGASINYIGAKSYNDGKAVYSGVGNEEVIG